MKKYLTIGLFLALLLASSSLWSFVAPLFGGSAKTNVYGASVLNPDVYFAVDPSNFTFGPAPAVNQTFGIAVNLYGVDASVVPAGLAGAEIRLVWNTTVIQPVNYTNKIGLDPGLGGVLNPPVLYGFSAGFYNDANARITGTNYTTAVSYRVAAASTGDPWFGNGTVAEMFFKVIYQPQEPQPSATSLLELAFTDLQDGNVSPVTHTKINGFVEVLPLVGPAIPGMTFSVSPSSRTINKGQVANYQLSVTSLNNFVANVAFSAVMDPVSDVMTMSINPPSVNLGANLTELSTLSVGNTTDAAVGTFVINVTANAGTIVESRLVNLTVQEGAAFIEATVVFERDPVNINMTNPNQTVPVGVMLPEGYALADIDVSSILLNDTLSPLSAAIEVDVVTRLVVQFDYVEFVNFVSGQGITLANVTFVLSGRLIAGTPFSGSDLIGISALFADIDCNGEVSLSDLVVLAMAYKTTPSDDNWNWNSDLAEMFGIISLTDLATIGFYYHTTITP